MHALSVFNSKTYLDVSNLLPETGIALAVLFWPYVNLGRAQNLVDVKFGHLQNFALVRNFELNLKVFIRFMILI